MHIVEESLILVGVIEVILVGAFLILAVASNRVIFSNRSGLGRLLNIRAAWSMSTATKAAILARTEKEAEELHQDTLSTFLRYRSDALVVGGLGLTAWAVLVNYESSTVGRAALQLLLVGVAFNLIAPMLIRSGPSEGSYLSLFSLISVGFTAIVFAVLLATDEYFKIGWFSTLVTISGPLVVLAVAREALAEFNRMRRLFRVQAAAAAQALAS